MRAAGVVSDRKLLLESGDVMVPVRLHMPEDRRGAVALKAAFVRIGTPKNVGRDEVSAACRG
jgi:hypothetical protein